MTDGGDSAAAPVDHLPGDPVSGGPGARADVWLWRARLFKSRRRAAQACAGRRVGRNGQPLDKAHRLLHPGDTVTLRLESRAGGGQTRVLRILALGTRRGPAAEARALYRDITPPSEAAAEPRPPQRAGGRPTKAARRAWAQFTGRD